MSIAINYTLPRSHDVSSRFLLHSIVASSHTCMNSNIRRWRQGFGKKEPTPCASDKRIFMLHRSSILHSHVDNSTGGACDDRVDDVLDDEVLSEDEELSQPFGSPEMLTTVIGLSVSTHWGL